LLVNGTDGAGPYMMVPSQTVPGENYTYVPNPYYYDKSAIRYTQVDVKVINNPASILEALQAGQLDVALGDASTALAAESAGFKVVESALGVRFFAFNTLHDLVPALKDVRVRQAINYAIDRKAIAYALFGRFGTPISSFNPADVNFGMDNYYTFDPAKARSLLAAAGYKDGFTMNGFVQGAYLGNLGQPLMQAVAQDLQAVGIKLNITPYPTDPEYATAVFSYKASLVDLATAGTYTPPIYSLFVAPKASVNFYGTDPEIAKLYNEGLTANNPTPYWKEMWQRFTTQAYTVPLLLSPLFFYVAKSTNGVVATNVSATALPTEWSPAS
jgi:peptide/nickel transport system substrate-binding protein